jgi:hypothetical protein
MGTQEIFAAIVTTVNPQHQTVTLRMQGGETVELRVAEPLLTELQAGDSVQVSISKSAGLSGMGSPSGTGTRPPRR